MSITADPAPAAVQRCTTEPVPKQGLTKPGHRATCPHCGYHSFRYDQQVTAELIARSHDTTCAARLFD